MLPGPGAERSYGAALAGFAQFEDYVRLGGRSRHSGRWRGLSGAGTGTGATDPATGSCLALVRPPCLLSKVIVDRNSGWFNRRHAC